MLIKPVCVCVPQRAADAALLRQTEEEAEPRPQEEAAVSPQAPPQGQEGGASYGETRGGEDSPERHGHPAGDGWIHGRRVQRQDLQPG